VANHRYISLKIAFFFPAIQLITRLAADKTMTLGCPPAASLAALPAPQTSKKLSK
jgi:hypothetical protein